MADGTFIASEDFTQPKFYILCMFPYPSGKGLHVGHPANYVVGDVVARKRRAQGFNVLHPMGWDAFGLPTEQRAIEEGVPPQQSTAEATANFRRQLVRCGLSYDWSREVATHDPAYYRWTQWIFTRLYEHGLAYEEAASVNWCPALGTVLANDEVIDGVSERGGHPVEVRQMTQWQLRITAFAAELAAALDALDWPEATKEKQRQRIAELHDWTFARQRYWGEPIPIVKRGDGSVHRALRDDELPLELPALASYAPTGTGESPLARAEAWRIVEEGGETFVRETQTMPGSAGSSWYFLRYCDPHNERELCARAKSDYWMPVDLYIGGPEHAVGHLMYARMWQRFLAGIGVVRDVEPFAALRHQGMIETAIVDQHGVRRFAKMSKRAGGVDPEGVIREHGADAMRVYLCFLGPVSQNKVWAPEGMRAQREFLQRFWALYVADDGSPRVDDTAPSDDELRILHRAIKKVSLDIDRLALNTAISALHVATAELRRLRTTARAVLAPLCQLIQPFAPHLAEELWANALGCAGGISRVPWPAWDEHRVTEDQVSVAVQIMGKRRGQIRIAADADEPAALAAARAETSLAGYLAGRTITRVIYKPGEILSLLVE